MGSAKDTSKTRFWFTDKFDLQLAREVYGLNPYEDVNRCATIQVNMIQITGKCVSIRTLRERIQNLVKKYLAKVGALQGKSGIEIFVTELDDLLQQIADLMSEFQGKKKILNKHNGVGNESSYIKGYNVREQSCASFVENDAAATETNSFQVEGEMHQDLQDVPNQVEVECTELPELTNVVELNYDEQMAKGNEEEERVILPPKPTPSKKRPLAQANILTPSKRKRRDISNKQSSIEYLNTKNQQQYEIRLRELALKERKQLLEEKKFELDQQERKQKMELDEKRWQMEEQKMKIELDLFASQQNLLANQQDLFKFALNRNTHL